MSDNLPPIVRAVFRQLDADPTLRSLAPGGVHFAQGPEDIPLPCVLITMPDAVQSIQEFGRTAYEDGTVRVFACDESASAVEAQAIADRIDWLLHDQRLDTGPDYAWMATFRTAVHAELVDEDDLAYQRRGGSYRVLMSRH